MPRVLFDKHDIRAMSLALDQSLAVKGNTGDNPAVGAVIYKGSRIISLGQTHLPGQDHAEKDALKKAGKKARHANLAVTLEPCCHVGRTGPCTQSIIQAGIKRVVAAIKDPNPKVNGKGLRELKQAGIQVESGLFRKEAFKINQDFFKHIRTGLPWVSLKAAMTLDGKIAADNGHSQWITSLASRKKVHELRKTHDAVLIGMGTARKDNPTLTVRHIKGKSPIRVILSSGSDLNPASNLAKSARSIKTILISSKIIKKPLCTQVNYVHIPGKKGPDIHSVLKYLGGMGIKSLLVEGGARIFTSFIEQKCIDFFYLFLAPKILGSGKPFFYGKKTVSIAESLEIAEPEVERTGCDILIKGKPIFN